MRKFLLPLLLLSVVIAGCTSTTKSTMTTDQLFQKKQECANLRDKIEEQINKNPDYSGCFNIKEIFYSPLRNSCLYIADSVWEQNKGDCLWGLTWWSNEIVFDYFTNEVVITNMSWSSDYQGKSDSFCFPKFLAYVDKNGKAVTMNNYDWYRACMLNEYYTRIQELKWE